MLVSKLQEEGFEEQNVARKYANKKFLKASLHAIDWSRYQAALEEDMNISS